MRRRPWVAMCSEQRGEFSIMSDFENESRFVMFFFLSLMCRVSYFMYYVIHVYVYKKHDL